MTSEELVAEIQAGAVKLMGQLWEQVEGLVKWKANHIMTALEGCGGRGVEFEDLYQSGYLAMVAAVNTYDPAAGGTFSTWFMFHLKTVFAETTGYRTQKGRQEPLNNYLSLDTPLTDDADSDTLADVVADPAGLLWRDSLEESMWREDLKVALDTAMASVPEELQDVLRLRYWDNMTLEAAGELRGVGKERIRQMENKAIRQLQKPSIACHLRPFYDFDFYCSTGLGAFQHTGMSIQERYLVIEEERKEREAQERKRSDEEWQKRVEESRRWLAEYAAQREVAAQLTPEEKERLLKLYGLA